MRLSETLSHLCLMKELTIKSKSLDIVDIVRFDSDFYERNPIDNIHSTCEIKKLEDLEDLEFKLVFRNNYSVSYTSSDSYLLQIIYLSDFKMRWFSLGHDKIFLLKTSVNTSIIMEILG